MKTKLSKYVVFRKIFSLLELIKYQFEIIYNNRLLNRQNFNNSRINNKKKNILTKDYWETVADNILDCAKFDNGKHFFLNKVVQDHLAAENNYMGYRLLKKIQFHKNGHNFLSKLPTSPWGAPFLLKKFPAVAPISLTHIANLLSIEDEFEKKIQDYNSCLDFGGGFGGFASCILRYNKSIRLTIVDLAQMLEVQRIYLNQTLAINNSVTFCENINNLKSSIELFNASFSFSEIPLSSRKAVEKFIITNCNKIHIIFQSNFHQIDNNKYMFELKNRLIDKGWTISVKPYHWYGWDNCFVLFGSTS